MKKLKWYGILFALFILFLYIMGIYDIFMMLSHNLQYYLQKRYSEDVVIYFTNYPLYMLVFWITNLACGILSPVLYFLKKNCAFIVSLTSGIADFILILLGLMFRNRFKVLGSNIFCFDVFILIITLLYGIYLYHDYKKLSYKEN